jgi:serine/threonine-protein kinase
LTTRPGEDDDPRIGEVVAGRYRVLAKIGRGGMGSVYEAEHVTTHKRFAVKLLLPGLGRIPEIARRFEREAKASSLLNHPNVVGVVDFGTLDDDATLYLVMEHVPGRSLADILEAGRVPTLRAIAVCRQVLEALAHAHAQGIVHRDLKPDNIMLLDAGRSDEERDIVKLLDFGIAKLEDPEGEKLTQAGVAFGTPDYMAPEQALGEEVDARADLYSLGVILYELLTGKRPFESSDKLAVLRMQVAVPPPSIGVDIFARPFAPELVAFVARTLEKRREDRYASASAMIEALDVATMAQATLDLKDPSALLLRVSMQRPVAAPPSPSLAPAPSGTAPPSPSSLSADVGQPLRSPPPGPAQVAPLELDMDRALRRDGERVVAAASTAPAPPVARRPRRRAWAVAGGVAAAAAAVAVAVVALRQHSGSAGSSGSGALASSPALPALIAPPPQKSDKTVAAEKRLEANDAAGAAAIVEARLAEPGGAEDAYAQLVLGHARFQLDRDADALASYETALGLAPALAADPAMRVNLAAMLGRKDRPKLAQQALELVFAKLGPIGHPLIIENAARGRTAALRKRAREMADERGLTGEVDLVSSYTLDLAQGATCRDRRDAIPRLRALRDKRAVAALKKARDRRGGFLNLSDVNDCLERDAQEAIDYLQALP